MGKTKFQWVQGEQKPDEQPEGRGRSRRKREAKAVEALVDELLLLSDAEVAALPMRESVGEALEKLAELTSRGGVRSGLRRQRLLVAGLLREEDVEEIRRMLPEGRGSSPRERALQRVERWRTRLLDEGDPALDALLAEHPEGDRTRLRQLVRQARKDRARPGERSGKAYRELFAELRALEGV